MTPDEVLNILTALFIIAPIFQGLVTVLLWRAWRTESGGHSAALQERFVNSIFRLIGAFALSSLAFNRALSLHINNDIAVYLLALSLVTTLVPSFYWLYLYYTDKF